MSDIWTLTEVRENTEQWRGAGMTADEILEELLRKFPSAFTQYISFDTAYELDKLVFGTGGDYKRSAYNYPKPGGIYIHDTDRGTEVYMCTSCRYFTFDKEVLLSPEMVAWVRENHRILDPVDFRQRFMQMFFSSTRAKFEVLHMVDNLIHDVCYSYSRAAYPSALGEWQYIRADRYDIRSKPSFYRVTAAGTMTCSVEFISAGDTRTWRAELWYAYLRAECGAFEPSDSVQRVITAFERAPVIHRTARVRGVRAVEFSSGRDYRPGREGIRVHKDP